MATAALTVSSFPNAKALPLWAGYETGLFHNFGLDLVIDETPSSKVQREKLVSGEIQIAQAAVDNALALIKADHDVIIVMGGEGGMNDFIVQDDIHTFADMRGRILVVDSPDTAYALQARRLLARAGLKDGVDYTLQPVGNARLRLKAMIGDRRYGGAVMNPPFSSEAQLRGMRSLGSLTALLGPYQAGGAFVMRRWAAASANLLGNYIKAYVVALRWIADPANRPKAVGLLVDRLHLAPEVAEVAYGQLVDPTSGFARDAKLDMIGIDNMLATRAATEGTGGARLDPGRFIDLSYYATAMRELAELRP